MPETQPQRPESQAGPVASGNGAPDPLASLHKMSTTAGLGTTDYVAINLLAVTAAVLGAASALVVMSDYFFVIPCAAIICAIIAIRQISGSAGTQTGRGIALAGALLAIGCSAVQGSRELIELRRNPAD